MIERKVRAPILPAMLLVLAGAAMQAAASEPISTDDAKLLDLRPFWTVDLALGHPLVIRQFSTLDDNLYALTPDNEVMAVHRDTGILRWTSHVARAGQRVLGPTHDNTNAYFTTQSGVYTFNRRTGKPATDPRAVKGFVIDLAHDTATINVGTVHGLDRGQRMMIHRRGSGERRGEKLGELDLTVVREREALGKIKRDSAAVKIDSGDEVFADVAVPLPVVPLPFAPSSAAICDGDNFYYGASNRRFYNVDLLDGVRHWEFTSTSPISALPSFYKDGLIVAGQDGNVHFLARRNKELYWSFETEGPIFEPALVDKSGVYVASSDRWVYCINPENGIRKWRKQFATSDFAAPKLARGTLFVYARGDGLYALDAANGNQRWKLGGIARYLAATEDTVYVAVMRGDADDSPVDRLMTLELTTGREIGTLYTHGVDFVMGVSDPLTIVVSDRFGTVECLRSTRSPYIKPAELAQVLREDRMAAGMKKKPAAASQPSLLRPELEDPFRSKSKIPPAAGAGVATGSEDSGKPTASAPADESEEKSDDGKDDSDKPDDDTEKPDDADKGDDDAKSDDDKADDDKPDHKPSDSEGDDKKDADTDDDGDGR